MAITRSSAALATLVPALLLMAGCGGSDDAADSTPSPAPSTTASASASGASDTLRVCTSVPFAPFEVADAKAAVGYSGFDIDLVKLIADDLEKKLVVKALPFARLESGAAFDEAGCDLVAAAMTITEARKEHVAFSTSYYDARQSLMVADGSKVAKLADLAGKKVGVEKGSTGEDYAKAHASGAMVTSYDSDDQLMAALATGEVAGVVEDLPVALEHQKSGKVTVVTAFDAKESYALAVAKDDTQLLASVDKELAKLRSNGILRNLYGTWFPLIG